MDIVSKLKKYTFKILKLDDRKQTKIFKGPEILR